ncbi:ABC transporter substrate-binding protein [Fundidesulfovibrio butyratiphilus]
MKRALSVLALFCILVAAAPPAQAGEATDTLRTAVDEVLNVLRQTRPGQPGRTEKLSTAMHRFFDPEELAKRTLANNWRNFSPEQQQRFTAAFVSLLENTYLRRIETYTDEKVVFLDESQLAENRAEVSTKIITSSKEVPIVYRLIHKSGWKVYDVVIEGVSLVQNYRQQFAQILSKESPAQLIDRVSSMAAS